MVEGKDGQTAGEADHEQYREEMLAAEQRASSLILQTQEIRAPCRLMRGRSYRVLIP
jgi:hypothetical protein